ncbi:MAG: hypothetical protein H6R10_3350 [Rhodocyclaceae bacterium]|nr:hypothetical protein [Rhodocyclaceae bacterium]
MNLTALRQPGARCLAALVAASVLGLFSPGVFAGSGQEKLQKIRAKWKPGEAMVPEFLTLYPCHEEDQPCGKLPPPAVEKVAFKGPLAGDAARGEKIALDVRWGNCAACHALPGAPGGSVGPSLADYPQRRPPVQYTYQRIWDGRVFNPDAHMPIYGTQGVLTEEEIRDVMAFLYQGKK